jgi:hypothetical protein
MIYLMDNNPWETWYHKKIFGLKLYKAYVNSYKNHYNRNSNWFQKQNNMSKVNSNNYNTKTIR